MANNDRPGGGIATGMDIITVERIARLAKNKKFVERVFTGRESAYAFSRRNPYRHLAGRFAAKEACMKALSTGLARGVTWHDVEVVNSPEGKPTLELTAAALELLAGRKAFLSIAYGAGTALAVVALE